MYYLETGIVCQVGDIAFSRGAHRLLNSNKGTAPTCFSMYIDLLTYFAGTKRLRSSDNEVADAEHISKKGCAAQLIVQTDQVCLYVL
jgi:hypothetical protein